MEKTKKPLNRKVKKFYIVLGLLMILLIPIGFLFGIVSDRQSYKEQAINDIKISWGDTQRIKAPVLNLIFIGKQESTMKTAALNEYNVSINTKTELRKKGIFTVPVYTADVSLKGDFKNTFGDLKNIKANLSFDVSDPKGFVCQPEFKLLNKDFKSTGGKEYSENITTKNSNIPFEIHYKIRGMNEIYVYPEGLNNNIKISSNWGNPEFKGHFLPSQKSITSESFSAEWNIPAIAVSSSALDSVAGVSFLLPVDNYRMAERAVKYAFLFLALTFLTYFIHEITSHKETPVHQLQYLMIGAAMLIFYLLLVSISEFTPFWCAYIIAAAMTIGLIGLYTYNVITKRKNPKFTILIVMIMSLLYLFLYVLLALQDLSLIIGSIGLFAIMSLVMYSTRNVEWYNDNQ